MTIAPMLTMGLIFPLQGEQRGGHPAAGAAEPGALPEHLLRLEREAVPGIPAVRPDGAGAKVAVQHLLHVVLQQPVELEQIGQRPGALPEHLLRLEREAVPGIGVVSHLFQQKCNIYLTKIKIYSNLMVEVIPMARNVKIKAE